MSDAHSPAAHAEPPLLHVDDISLSFGGVHALRNVSLDVEPHEIFSVIGPNGAGKTSLLNSISGRYRPQSGSIRFKGEDVTGYKPNKRCERGIGRTFQNLALYNHMSVLGNIMVGRHHQLRNNFVTGPLYWFSGAQREELQHRREVEEIIDFLEITHIRKSVAGTLSYGLRKRVELARAMALKPDLLLLDEPMAGMNHEEKEDMARFIIDLNEEWGVTVVMIEHDMGVVMDISHRVAVLDFGQRIAHGGPEEVMANPRVKQAYLGEGDEEGEADTAGAAAPGNEQRAAS
jgi:branched-chain amino acid transport system ATP-binding protein